MKNIGYLEHEHKFGADLYLFEYESNDGETPDPRDVAAALGVNYEPEKGEELALELWPTTQVLKQHEIKGMGKIYPPEEG